MDVVGDFIGACQTASKVKDAAVKRNLFMKIFLTLTANKKDNIQAIHFILSHHGSELDCLAVLSEIPDDWSVEFLAEFLAKSQQSIYNRSMDSGICKRVYKSLLFQV